MLRLVALGGALDVKALEEETLDGHHVRILRWPWESTCASGACEHRQLWRTSPRSQPEPEFVEEQDGQAVNLV